ncbi:MAG: hypothetical protein R3Y06_00065 [Faecalibacterium sp.]
MPFGTLGRLKNVELCANFLDGEMCGSAILLCLPYERLPVKGETP